MVCTGGPVEGVIHTSTGAVEADITGRQAEVGVLTIDGKTGAWSITPARDAHRFVASQKSLVQAIMKMRYPETSPMSVPLPPPLLLRLVPLATSVRLPTIV